MSALASKRVFPYEKIKQTPVMKKFYWSQLNDIQAFKLNKLRLCENNTTLHSANGLVNGNERNILVKSYLSCTCQRR